MRENHLCIFFYINLAWRIGRTLESTRKTGIWRHISNCDVMLLLCDHVTRRVPIHWLVKGWRWRWLSYIQKHFVRLNNQRTPSLFHPDVSFHLFLFFMVWMNDFLSFSQRKIIRILVRTLVLQVLDLKRNYDLQGSPKREFWKKKKVVHERHEKISTTWYLLEVVRMIMTAQRERRGERGIPGTFGASHVVLRLVCE